MSTRLTRKQRLKLKRDREADHKAFMRRGEIRRRRDADRDAASRAKAERVIESPRERHLREQREAAEARLAERRADHDLAEGYVWAVAMACVGRETELREKLCEAKIPHFRAQDEIVQIMASGRPRKLKVPILAGTIFVGIEHRDRLAELAETYPWLMQRVPGERFGRAGHEVDAPRFPWLVERLERAEVVDASGMPALVPAVIPEAQMRRFADCLIGAAPILEGGDTIHVGETVRVADGPFASFSGAVEAVSETTGKLTVAVNIFGRLTPVELDWSQIERT